MELKEKLQVALQRVEACQEAEKGIVWESAAEYYDSSLYQELCDAEYAAYVLLMDIQPDYRAKLLAELGYTVEFVLP